MKSSRATHLSLLAAVLIPVATAQAQVVFPLDGGEGQSSFTQTVGGITLTVDNVTPSNDIFASGAFYLFGSNYPYMNGFQVHFDANREITQYTISGFNAPTGATFSLFGPNGDSLNNPLDTIGTFSLSSPFFLYANEIGTLTSSFPDPNGYSQVESLTTVPEPGTWTLIAGAAASLFALFRRRRPKLE